MQGLHLTADLRGCAADQASMTQPERLRELCLEAVRRAGLQAVGELFHRFDAAPAGAGGHAVAQSGITGVVLLAQSHLAVHTWPELGAVTIDLFVCNVRGDHSRGARMALDGLVQAFAPAEVSRQELRRAGASATGLVRA
jgi:S-adenosylmethionine decarboxylase